MISIERNTITLDGETSPIVKWTVWFYGPGGIFSTREEVVNRAKMVTPEGEDVDILIKPIACAIAENGNYEYVL